MSRLITRALIAELNAIIRKWSADSHKIKRSLLSELSQSRLPSSTALKQYYEALLFISGYPDCKTTYDLAQAELQRISTFLGALDKDRKESLVNSGLPFTEIRVHFSQALIKHLCEYYPANTSLYYCDTDPEQAVITISNVLPQIIVDQHDNRNISDLIKWIESNKGDGSQSSISWLVDQFDHSSLNTEIKETLFEQLYLAVTWEIESGNDKFFHSPGSQICYHEHLITKNISIKHDFKKRKPLRVRLSANDKDQLLHTATILLASLLKETSHVSNADVHATELFDTGRGIQIALFYGKPDTRIPFETTIGYMSFKNGVPYSYGGTWISDHSARIGYHVFPWFRGGESSFTFAGLLNLFHREFNIQQFIVEQSQIGKDNQDGIKSGSYWFYYRLGFRSILPDQQKMAKSEWDTICKNKAYRTSYKSLRYLSESPMSIELTKTIPTTIDSKTVSEIVSNHVSVFFAGNYHQAQEDCTSAIVKEFAPKSRQSISKSEQQIIKEFSLLLSAIPERHNWSDKQKMSVWNTIISKGGKFERDYILNLQSQKFFTAAIRKLHSKISLK